MFMVRDVHTTMPLSTSMNMYTERAVRMTMVPKLPNMSMYTEKAAHMTTAPKLLNTSTNMVRLAPTTTATAMERAALTTLPTTTVPDAPMTMAAPAAGEMPLCWLRQMPTPATFRP